MKMKGLALRMKQSEGQTIWQSRHNDYTTFIVGVVHMRNNKPLFPAQQPSEH